MKVLIAGGTGFVGTALARRLTKAGAHLTLVSRLPEIEAASSCPYPANHLSWKTLKEKGLPSGLDAVINLAGAPVAPGRWSKKRKTSILKSRVNTTRNLVESIKALPEGQRPKVMLNASAIGFYGDSQEKNFVESDGPGSGFLAQVCKAWESELFNGIEGLGVRAICLRIGLVLGPGGGALKPLVSLTRLGALGRLGSGKQAVSFIHLADLVRVIEFSIQNAGLSGPINCVAARPTNNTELTKSLNRHFGKWGGPPVPSFVMKLILGEAAGLVLGGQSVEPKKLLESGFEFQFSETEPIFKNLYPNPRDHVFEVDQWVPASPEAIFPFFSEARNLEKITPDFLGFKITEAPDGGIEQGSLIKYKLRVHGLPMRWTTRITEWAPPAKFADEQLKGPYSKWYHEHFFTPAGAGTLLTDRVAYRLPLGRLGWIAGGALVRRDVGQIFDHRRQVIAKLFG